MSQAGIKPEIRALATRIVSFEADLQDVAEADTLATCRVCEKLRRPLIMLTGMAGFSSLLARALTLAKREAPVLTAVQVDANGSLEGLEGDAALAHNVIVAYLVSLLITFIGETLTMQLLLDVWPDLPGLGLDSLEKESK